MKYQRHQVIDLIVAVVIVALGSAIIAVSILIKNRISERVAGEITEDGTPDTPPRHLRPNIPSPEKLVAVTQTDFINLQPTVDAWLKTLNSGSEVGLMIYDITNSKIAASYQPDKVFNVASIYKLLFVYDGYRQIALDADDGEEFFTHTAEKGDLTLYQCLDLAIRESYNGCADKLASNSYRASRVRSLVRTFAMTNTSGNGLQSTAADLTKLLRIYWRHDELNDSLWAKITDSMLNQPPSLGEGGKTYDWRQGLPAGFSDQVKVYDKVGWEWNEDNKIWNTYADAAILEFTESKHCYTMVVLTKNLTNYKKLSELGTLIETAVLESK